jgi:large subunit ribosomal protein L5
MKSGKQKTSKGESVLMKSLGIDNKYALPEITHVVVNTGVGKQRDDKSFVEAVKKDLAKITGQQPQARTARKAVAGFSVRQGNLVGLRVTLRGKRKDDFVNRFVSVTLPRVRDFRGVKVSSFDGSGNLSFGLEEQLAFPEINPEKTDVVFGVQVTFVTSARNDEEGKVLFEKYGFPLVEMDKEQKLT